MEIENATEARLRQSDPNTHARAHIERGQQLLAQGFADEAEQQFREAVMLNPADPDAHAGLGAALSSSDAAAARKEFATALQLHPSADTYVALARLDLRDNRVQEAGAGVDRALALDPANAAAQALKRDIAARAAAPAPPK
jgi:Flp pilus assembly protein TadD